MRLQVRTGIRAWIGVGLAFPEGFCGILPSAVRKISGFLHRGRYGGLLNWPGLPGNVRDEDTVQNHGVGCIDGEVSSLALTGDCEWGTKLYCT